MHFKSEEGAQRGINESRFVGAYGISSCQIEYANELFLHDEFNMHLDHLKPLYYLTKISALSKRHLLPTLQKEITITDNRKSAHKITDNNLAKTLEKISTDWRTNKKQSLKSIDTTTEQIQRMTCVCRERLRLFTSACTKPTLQSQVALWKKAATGPLGEGVACIKLRSRTKNLLIQRQAR